MSTTQGRPATETDLFSAEWRKSSHSSGNGACVETALLRGSRAVGARDSKAVGGPVLLFGAGEWAAFAAAAAKGEFTRP